MKKILILFVTLFVLLSSCASPSYMMINDTVEKVRPYGWANKKTAKNENVLYELSPGSIIIGALFYPTIWVPVWMVGWKLYKPVSIKESVK
jgi:hypothetical protein